jgi:hypothetical protein
MNKVLIRPTGATLINYLKSSRFGVVLLVCSTMLEGFYAYKLFSLTGHPAFGVLTLPVAIIYAIILSGVIVFFSLRGNMMIVWAAVGFELAMNTLLDIQMVILPRVENWFWVFISQLLIGIILPLATKAFADELNKREVSRDRIANR